MNKKKLINSNEIILNTSRMSDVGSKIKLSYDVEKFLDAICDRVFVNNKSYSFIPLWFEYEESTKLFIAHSLGDLPKELTDAIRDFNIDNIENNPITEKSALENTVTIKLSNQCKVPSISVTHLVFSTKRGKNETFSISIDDIIKAEGSSIHVNSIHSYPAMQFTITSLAYSHIKPKLDVMDGVNYQLMPETH